MLALLALIASAQEPDAAELAAGEPVGPTVEVGGYVEAFWAWNFNDPENGVTALRGFDNRHDVITLSNVAVEVDAAWGPVNSRIVLQAGITPTTYYLAEPTHPATQGAGASDATVWRHVQTAFLGWQATDALRFEAGIFLSPIGPEGMAVRDDWLFSRSTPFYGLPFYHTGVRATIATPFGLSATLALYEGWNSVVDNNSAKSVSGQLLYAGGPLTASLLYFGGNERPDGAAEGHPWRNTLDAWAQVDATEWFSFLIHGDLGVERNAFGASQWATGAVMVRFQPVEILYLSARGDWFGEQAADGAGAIFWPLDSDGNGRVAAVTAGVDVRPFEGLSLRVEGRLDSANTDAYFKGDVAVDSNGADVPDAPSQATVTAAAVAWF